jgi:hypothetical protein
MVQTRTINKTNYIKGKREEFQQVPIGGLFEPNPTWGIYQRTTKENGYNAVEDICKSLDRRPHYTNIPLRATVVRWSLKNRERV